MVWSLADRIKNLIEKKGPGLSDSDMVTGGLKMSETIFPKCELQHALTMYTLTECTDNTTRQTLVSGCLACILQEICGNLP